jgi:hypothetical protein
VVESRAWIEGLALDEASAPIANAPIVVRAGGQDRTLRSLADGSFRCAVTPGEVLVLPGDESDFPWRPVEGDAFRERVEDGRTLRTARVRFHARADDGPEGSLQRARDLRAEVSPSESSARRAGRSWPSWLPPRTSRPAIGASRTPPSRR